MAINHGSLSANLTPRGVVGGRVQNSVLAYENDYENLINKPSINDTELNGDLSLEDLGIVNNVQPDWEQTDIEAGDYINNKPDIPENLLDLNDDADHRTVSDTEKTTWNNKSDFSGSYNDLTDKPVIPDAQIQSDWNQNDNTKADFIKNKPTIPAEQVNSDWNAESGKAQILNKPSIPTALADLTDDSTHRTVTDTEKTAWNSGEANVQSNWNETDTTSDAYIQNKPSIPSVTANPGSTTATLSSIGIDGINYAISGGSGGGAVNSVNGKTGDVTLGASDVGALPNDTPLFSGDYEDLTNKPTIPTVNNSTITIQKNGQNVDSFTLNQNTNKAIDISVPTKTSDITNDSSFITNTVNNLANYYLKSETYTKTEVSNLIDAAVNGRFEKVQTLPVTGEANVIYLVPKTTALTNNVYDEYIWQDNAWELLGSTEIDLSGYVTDTDLATALANYVTTSAFNTAIANYYNKTEVGNLLDSKVDKVSGKGLSTNDYSNTDKAIVDGVTSALANKADKVSGATNGNLAGFDVNGNLTDSGIASAIFPSGASASDKLVKASENNFKYEDFGGSARPDFNTLTTPGVYSVYAGSAGIANQHSPQASTWFSVYVSRINDNPDYVQQLAYHYKGTIYARIYDNGTWSDWSVFIKNISQRQTMGLNDTITINNLEYDKAYLVTWIPQYTSNTNGAWIVLLGRQQQNVIKLSEFNVSLSYTLTSITLTYLSSNGDVGTLTVTPI